MTPPPASPVRGVRAGDVLTVGGGVLVFAFSFAPFVQYAGEVREGLPAGLETTGRFSAWSAETFMVPLTTFVVLAAVLAVAATAVRIRLRRDPELLGFRVTQLEVGLGLFMLAVLLGMITSEKYLFFGAGGDEELRALTDTGFPQLEVGWGAVMMLAGSALAVAGAGLNHVRSAQVGRPG